MPIHKLKLLAKQEVAKGTLTFKFEKPAGFTFTPGQYGGFTLMNTTGMDPTSITRRFSLLSTPDDAHIAIAMRMQDSPYKRCLKDLPIGSEIKFAGPSGAFTLHEDLATPAIFIAGGIGITPFYSMITYASKHQLPHNIQLFYGNQTPDDSAFLNELTQLTQTNSYFKFIPTMANADNNWQGEKGFVTHTMIKKYVPDISQPIFYICGSPAMVTAMQELLLEMGVSADKIRIEDFPGY